MNSGANTFSSIPFLDQLKELFYEGMDRHTSICLYGSAATGNWITARSDLDLLILVAEEKLDLLGNKIKEWKSKPTYPILDGFVLFPSGNFLMSKRLDDFQNAARPVVKNIQLIDLWNIKNRSKHLAGKDFVNEIFPDLTTDQLRAWAIEEIKYSVGSLRSNDVPKTAVVLSGLIWSVSWSARMLMLARGYVCESKREALEWLANEYPEVRDIVVLLLNDYMKSDKEAASITSEQSLVLRRFCLELMLREIKSAGP